MLDFLRRRKPITTEADRLRIAEETIAKVTKAADRKNAPITEVRSILEAGRVKMRLCEEKRGRG
ncbi:MAG: hypothetical protein WAZ60_23780 [Desulfosalsimonadaceae bacterium]